MSSIENTIQKRVITHQVVWGVYLVFREVRVLVLQSIFGFVSSCKHQPTCGENLLLEIQKKGLVKGGISGASQLFRCV